MNTHPYDLLHPDVVIDAVESVGYLSDARLLALNSYENRVYQVGIEDDTPLIAKFYRPQRWSEAQILEEHSFSLELQDADISVVAPLVAGFALGALVNYGHSSHHYYRYQYQRQGHYRQRSGHRSGHKSGHGYRSQQGNGHYSHDRYSHKRSYSSGRGGHYNSRRKH